MLFLRWSLLINVGIQSSIPIFPEVGSQMWGSNLALPQIWLSITVTYSES